MILELSKGEQRSKRRQVLRYRVLDSVKYKPQSCARCPTCKADSSHHVQVALHSKSPQVHAMFDGLQKPA